MPIDAIKNIIRRNIKVGPALINSMTPQLDTTSKFAQHAPEILRFPQPGVEVMHLLAFHPVELARQLTIIDSRIFKMIPLPELVHQYWNKPEKYEKARYIMAMIDRLNYVRIFKVSS